MANSGAGGRTGTAIPPDRIRMEVRNRFNPLRTLTPDLLSRYLDNFKLGFLREIAQVWEALEERDPMLKAVATKRKKAVSRLSWEILKLDESEEANAQKATLEFFYNNLTATSVLEQNQRGGVSLLIRQMMNCVGQRYAPHEIVWRPGYRGVLKAEGEQSSASALARGGETKGSKAQVIEGLTAEFRLCPLWFFENITGRLRFLEVSTAIEGVDMPDGEWMVTVGDGIMEACSVAWMFKNLPMKDWLALSEKFGMPGVLGKTDASKGSERWEALVAAVQAFGQDFAAVASTGDTIELVEMKGGANAIPQPALVELCDRYMATLWRGADLSTMSAKQGPGQGASLQQNEADVLEEDDAQLITETLNLQVDPYVIRYQHGDAPVLAYFKLRADAQDEDKEAFKRDVWKGFLKDGTTSDMLANLTSLRKLTEEVGLPTTPDYEEPWIPVRDAQGGMITGGTQLDAEGDIVGGQAEPGPTAPEAQGAKPADPAVIDPGLANDQAARAVTKATQQKLFHSALDALSRAQADDLQPLRERLAGVLEILDTGNVALFRTALEKFRADLPGLRAKINENHQAATVLGDAMSAAMFNGMVEGEVKHTH